MGISVLYVRISSLDGKTDRQRVSEKEFDRVIEDRCSGSVPIFQREGGRRLKNWIDEGVITSISIWQIDRSGRDLRDILNFIYYTSERKIPIHSFTGDDGDVNKKRTGRNTDPSCVVAGTGLEPVTFGL